MSSKTHKSTSKRFKKTASGKLLRKKPGFGHLLRRKSAKQKRSARVEDKTIGKGHEKRLKQLISRV